MTLMFESIIYVKLTFQLRSQRTVTMIYLGIGHCATLLVQAVAELCWSSLETQNESCLLWCAHLCGSVLQWRVIADS